MHWNVFLEIVGIGIMLIAGMVIFLTVVGRAKPSSSTAWVIIVFIGLIIAAIGYSL